MVEFFGRNFILVYFFYGLSFYSMGLAILLEVSHSSELDFAKALRPLGWFGILHGSHEWLEMFLLIQLQAGVIPGEFWIGPLRLILLSSSFLLLIDFGARLITGQTSGKTILLIMMSALGIWLLGLVWLFFSLDSTLSWFVAADVYTRYSLAIPGAALTVWGLILQKQRFYQAEMKSFGQDVIIAAVAFGLYGAIGQLFASPSIIFPSSFLNAEIFLQWFGFPIQVFRASMACVTAIFIIRSLRAFQVENNRQIEELRLAQIEERRRLETLRSELLHRTVKAQELERQRIARELHDETGQSITALSLGLRALAEMIPHNPTKAMGQVQQLQDISKDSLKELQRLVAGLHPPQLDDLGLTAALRWFANETQTRYGQKVNVYSEGDGNVIPIETRVVLFRIAQEAVTNVIRHANASEVSIRLSLSSKEVLLQVEDNGIGFDFNSTIKTGIGQSQLGLLGMIERATLVGGTCSINSQPGKGTQVIVRVPITPGES